MFKEVVINYNDLKLKGHLTYGDDVKAWVVFEAYEARIFTSIWLDNEYAQIKSGMP